MQQMFIMHYNIDFVLKTRKMPKPLTKRYRFRSKIYRPRTTKTVAFLTENTLHTFNDIIIYDNIELLYAL